MIQHTPTTDLFKQQLRTSFLQESENSSTIEIAKNANVYNCGDNSKNIYFIEHGQIKLLMLSPEGKECLLAIYTDGDIFGEMCLSGFDVRMETAKAMKNSRLKRIECSRFLSLLSADFLLEGFVSYLTMRIADQQEVITNLVTVDSEQRLGKTLLKLARKIGRKAPHSILINHKISQEELSEMVGTTRPRINKFMRKFLKLNLIEMTAERFIIVKEKNLTTYLNYNRSGR